MKFKIKNVPLSTIDWFMSNAIFSFSVWNPRRSSIRLKSFFCSKRQKFVSDLLIVLFEVFKPREVFRIPNYSKKYHHGWALNPGMISGHPFWRGELGGMIELLILAMIQGRRWSKLPLLSAKWVLMNLVAATFWSSVRK